MRISVIVPAYNAAGDLRLCLAAVRASASPPAELIVADDGSTDDTAAVARQFGATVVTTGGPSGPARARNLGAQHATGATLVFFDADVVPHRDAIGRIAAAFEADPGLDALIGAYDDAPADGEFLSQYKNLQHCFVHRKALRAASTFWTGCGAVRREIFQAHGGFLESYRKPSIEDIEFGRRLIGAGRRIVLDPAIQVKHLKRWTFRDLVRTDIFQRAVPWTGLIYREGRLPDDLNVAVSQRVAAAAALLALGILAAGTWSEGLRFLAAFLGVVWLALGAFWADEWRRAPVALAWLGAGAALWWMGRPLTDAVRAPAVALALMLGAWLTLNLGFLRFLSGRRGWPFAAAAAPFFLLYFIYSSVTFVLVSARHKLFGSS
jgi:glycosyltransferase involved in cell wall biosynthesis